MSLLSFFSGRSKLRFKYLHPLNPELHKEIINPRPVLIEEVVDDLLDGTPVVISAPKLTGKTTFLFLVARALQSNSDEFYPIYIDLQGIEPDTTKGVAAEILNGLREYARQIDDGEQLVVPEESDLQLVIEAALSSRFGRVVLLFDGIDGIARETGLQLLKLLKAAISRTVLRSGEIACPFMVAGALDLLLDGHSAAMDFARVLYLEDFTKAEVRELLARVGKGVFFDDAIERVHEFSGGHPQLVQHLSAIAHQLMTKEQRKTIDAHDIQRAADSLVEQNTPLFSSTFQRMDAQGIHRGDVERLSAGDVPFTRLRREVLIAEQVGIIKGVDGVCRIRNPLIRRVLDHWEPRVVESKQPQVVLGPAADKPDAPA